MSEVSKGGALSPNELMKSQLSAVELVLKRFGAIVREVRDTRGQEANAPPEPAANHFDGRPHHAFVIDGRRGAGKTYTLAAIENALKQLSAPPASGVDPWLKGLLREDFFGAVAAPVRSPATVLRVIFPGDMEGGDSLMEAILADIRQSLANVAKPPDEDKDLPVSPEQKKRRQEARNLGERLRNEIAQGWYYARQFGLDALIRDSIDYKDLVASFEEESGKAAGRVRSWLEFVPLYLDFMGADTLVVLFDDSDVGADVTADILHSIRMFLSHPRIVTVLAGNLSSMRESLILKGMNRIGEAIKALAAEDRRTAQDWRRSQRQMVEEYLDKVLPPAHRIHLKRPAGGRSGGDDFKKVARNQSLDNYISSALAETRGPFLEVKFRLALEREVDMRDVPFEGAREKLDDFLSWWFFANTYREFLEPQSARQIATMRDFYEDNYGREKQAGEARGKEPARASMPRAKRLAVALFSNPANFTLIQRMGDDDDSLPAWLRQQTLKSSWHGRRYFTINGREAAEGSYTHRYLRYRLDLGVGLPIRDNVEGVLANELLPAPIGRRFMRRFLQPRQMPRRHRTIGAARWIDHAAIPANCVYFHDLSALPDIAFIDTGSLNPEQVKAETKSLQSGAWEADLASKIYELIDDRPEDSNHEHLVRYFREIVCESLRMSGAADSATLMAVLDPPDIIEKQSRAIYQYFITDELESFNKHIDVRRRAWWTAFNPDPLQDLEPETSNDQVPGGKPEAAGGKSGKKAGRDKETLTKKAMVARAVALYTALLTDLRRAWFAIRIYEASPTLGPGRTETVARASLAALTNRDRMPLYTYTQIERMLKRSAWTSTMLEVFTFDNIKLAQDHRKMWSDEMADDYGSIFTLGSPSRGSPSIIGGTQILEETYDFRHWTSVLRGIGRAACEGWPIQKGDASIEEHLFTTVAADGKSVIRRERFNILQKGEAHDPEESRQQASNGREARNLVWLLYGLAPSLPAVIHAETMGLIYEAKLQEKAAGELMATRPGDAKQLYRSAADTWAAALGNLDRWTTLIGQLSVIMRYIKIKSLHLDMWIALTEAERRLASNPPDESAKRLLDRLFRTVKYEKIYSGQNPYDVRTILRDLITCFAGGSPKHLSPDGTIDLKGAKSVLHMDLAMFPDVPASSLFGDGWMADLLTRNDLKAKLPPLFRKSIKDQDAHDNSLSTNGIFGETEQWLWTTNRGLRKLNEMLGKNVSAEIKQRLPKRRATPS